MSFHPFFDPGGVLYLSNRYLSFRHHKPRPLAAHITHQRGLFSLRLTLGDLLDTINGGTHVKFSGGHTARLVSELIRSFESPSHDFLTGHCCAPLRRVDLAAKICNVTAGVILTGIQYHLGIARTSSASRRFVWTSFAALDDALSGRMMAHERRTRACQSHLHGALFGTCHGGCIAPSSHY